MKFKRDKYKSARAGHSRLLEIRCRKCEAVVALYQKDGPGNLRRMYMDRINEPERLVDLQKKFSLAEIEPLACPGCGITLGTPIDYEKEHRLAFRLYVDAVTKRIRKAGER